MPDFTNFFKPVKDWPGRILDEDSGLFTVFLLITSGLERLGPSPDKEDSALFSLLDEFLRITSRPVEGDFGI
jgi:hypothetical protein